MSEDAGPWLTLLCILLPWQLTSGGGLFTV